MSATTITDNRSVEQLQEREQFLEARIAVLEARIAVMNAALSMAPPVSAVVDRMLAPITAPQDSDERKV